MNREQPKVVELSYFPEEFVTERDVREVGKLFRDGFEKVSYQNGEFFLRKRPKVVIKCCFPNGRYVVRNIEPVLADHYHHKISIPLFNQFKQELFEGEIVLVYVSGCFKIMS